MKKITIALPNGSLEDGTKKLFEKAGLEISKQERKHLANVKGDFFTKAIFTRSQHIPQLVARQVNGYDLGICGQDYIAETGSSVKEIVKLNFSKVTSGPVKIVLFAANSDPLTDVAKIPNGTEILTEYPQITKKFFRKLGIKIKAVFSRGSTESDVPDGYRFGVSVTETGTSLRENDQKIIATLMESSTVLIANPKSLKDPEKAEMIYAIKKLLLCVIDSRGSVLVMFNTEAVKLENILKIIPALKQPTVSSLVNKKFCAVSAVINKNIVNDVMIKALQAGATDWIELPINKLVKNW